MTPGSAAQPLHIQFLGRQQRTQRLGVGQALGAELAKYPNADVVWCQEEPENMGAWHFLDRRIEALLQGMGHKAARPRYVGRPEAASPATGLLRRHNKEQARLVDEALTIA